MADLNQAIVADFWGLAFLFIVSGFYRYLILKVYCKTEVYFFTFGGLLQNRNCQLESEGNAATWLPWQRERWWDVSFVSQMIQRAQLHTFVFFLKKQDKLVVVYWFPLYIVVKYNESKAHSLSWPKSKFGQAKCS